MKPRKTTTVKKKAKKRVATKDKVNFNGKAFSVNEIANAVYETAIEDWGNDEDNAKEAAEEVLRKMGVVFTDIQTIGVKVVQ